MTRRYAPIFPTPTMDQVVALLAGLTYFERRQWLRKKLTEPYPRFLYRYTQLDYRDEESVKHLRETLVESELWLSSPAGFNDPFDMSIHVTFSGNGAEKKRALKSKFKSYSSWKRRQQRIDELLANPEKTLAHIREVFRTNLKNCGVCCFTPNPKNILMWSHYAAHHTGIVLQFHPALDPNVLTMPVPVDYSDSFPIVDWRKETYAEIRNAMLVKSLHWNYENEWRIVHPDGANSRLIFRPEALTGVIIGCRTSDRDVQELVKILAERINKGYPAISVYRANTDSQRFKLSIRQENL